MMHSALMSVRLPFETDEDRESSEYVLMGLLGYNCMVNHRYLLQHEGVQNLYDSGVTYIEPAQVSPNRLKKAALRRVAKVLRAEGAEPYMIATILRILNGVEEFVDIYELYKRGKGDCNQLVPVRIAELWRTGVGASPYLTMQPRKDGISYHAIVLWPDGSSEDPSLILGMGGPARDDERREEIRKNSERWAHHMQAARHLVEAEGAPPDVLGKQIDMMGLVPRDGIFRA